jgi:hypothetical protein
VSLGFLRLLDGVPSLLCRGCEGTVVPGLLKEVILIKDAIVSSSFDRGGLGLSFGCFCFGHSSSNWGLILRFDSLLTFLNVLTLDKG